MGPKNMTSDMTLPTSINPTIAVILDDAKSRGVIESMDRLAPMLLMSQGALYNRRKQRNPDAWTFRELTLLMANLTSAGCDDLAGAVIRLIHPGLDIGFRAEILGKAAEGGTGNVIYDEAVLSEHVANLLEETALALEDGSVDAAEHNRISAALNRINRALSGLGRDLEARVER